MRSSSLVQAAVKSHSGQERVLCGVAIISGIALLIIGCIATAGKFPTPVFGWTLVGVSIISAVATIAATRRDKGMVISALVQAAIMVTLGVLGGTGILSPCQVGKGLIGAWFGMIPLAGILSTYCEPGPGFGEAMHSIGIWAAGMVEEGIIEAEFEHTEARL